MMSSRIPSPIFHNTNIDSGWLKTSSPSASHCHIARASFPVILHGDVGALSSKPLLVVIRIGKTADVVRAWFITRVDEESVPQSEELRTRSSILGLTAAAGTFTTNEVQSTSLTETLACS